MKSLRLSTITRIQGMTDSHGAETEHRERARRGPDRGGALRIGDAGALALAAASTGVVVPVLRAIVENTGHGPASAGVFIAAHVIGGVIGAAWGKRALRVAGSSRTLAAAALIASITVTLAMAALDSLELRIGLRFIDGACHLLAVTALVAAATAGDADRRARRAMIMGQTIVLGVAGGLGVGACIGHPEVALVVAALLSGAALLVVLTRVAVELPPVAPPSRSHDRGPIAPGLLAFGERFLFGALSVATPFFAPPTRVALVLGACMTASVGALGLARRYALTWGPRRLAVRSALALALVLASTAIVDVFASPGPALVWAIACGAAAGALYASALVLAARSAELEDRMRDMAAVHAAGNAGHALGAVCAGMLISVLPDTLVVAVPSLAIITVAMVGVWVTVPAAARSCPEVARKPPSHPAGSR